MFSKLFSPSSPPAQLISSKNHFGTFTVSKRLFICYIIGKISKARLGKQPFFLFGAGSSERRIRSSEIMFSLYRSI